MFSALALKARMYLTMIVMFALGYGLLYATMVYLGATATAIVAIAILFIVAQWYFAPDILRIAGRLRYVGDDEYPELHAAVGELASEAHVPAPRIAVSPAKETNAFVFGRTVKSATLVVHQGLLDILDKDEMKAVLAHEVGHLRHNDVVVMTIIAFIPMLAYIIAQNMFWGGMFGGGRNDGMAYLFLIGLVAFVVYAISQLFMLSLSRARESYADDYSARSTRSPEHLASALVKISSSHASTDKPSNTSTVARSFYIVDFFSIERDIAEMKQHEKELRKLLPGLDVSELINRARKERAGAWGSMNSVFATHPPTYRRLLDLAEVKRELDGA